MKVCVSIIVSIKYLYIFLRCNMFVDRFSELWIVWLHAGSLYFVRSM